MSKQVFDDILASNDMFEWSVGACLNAQQRHDPKVIQEVASVDEATEMLERSVYFENQREMLEGNRDHGEGS